MIIEIVPELGCDDDLIPPARKRLRQEPFAFAVTVHVGRVKEIDPAIQGALQ